MAETSKKAAIKVAGNAERTPKEQARLEQRVGRYVDSLLAALRSGATKSFAFPERYRRFGLAGTELDAIRESLHRSRARGLAKNLQSRAECKDLGNR